MWKIFDYKPSTLEPVLSQNEIREFFSTSVDTETCLCLGNQKNLIRQSSEGLSKKGLPSLQAGGMSFLLSIGSQE